MTTLAQFRTAVSSKVGLDNSTSGDQPMIDLWVNEGVVDVMMRTACRMRCAQLVFVPGTWKYQLPSNILKVYDAYTTGVSTYPLEQVSVDELMEMQVQSANPISPATYYAVGGSDFLLVYPTPQTADTLNIFYTPRPATLSVSSDSPDEIPSEFHKAIEFYALREAADLSDDGTSQQGNQYLQMYEQWIKRIKKWTQLKGNHRLPRATVGTGVGMPYNDRSRYP